VVTAAQIALSHHERWDGTGYPFGFSGDDIPLSARLVTLADVYDALTSTRVYKEAMSHEHARDQIAQASAGQFDPAVVEAFLAVEARFRQVARELRSPREPAQRAVP
jgi:response regulator RpfG family c-di-GMP phosphodiesterase